ncbi:MAG: VOC family protein [Flavobacteriales bacterium]|nr:VOC family protein [Flavobacteriales bacterium]MCB9191790.1 VOC family protein [Flavobacteriales bacterium]
MDERTGKEKKWSEWFEIPVLDMQRAKTFYEMVFDTQIHVMELGPTFQMGIFPHTEVGCALVYNPDFYKPADGGVTVYLNANPDLQVALDKIEAAGGKVLVPKKQIDPEHGYMALFLDSEGNRMALHSMK